MFTENTAVNQSLFYWGRKIKDARTGERGQKKKQKQKKKKSKTNQREKENCVSLQNLINLVLSKLFPFLLFWGKKTQLFTNYFSRL